MRENMSGRTNASRRHQMIEQMLTSKRRAASAIADPVRRHAALSNVDQREYDLKRVIVATDSEKSRIGGDYEVRSARHTGERRDRAGPCARDEPARPERRFTMSPRRQLRIDRRDTSADSLGTMNGYGAVFYDGTRDTEYVLWDYAGERCVERVIDGAFDRALRERHDAAALMNHNEDLLLGRVSSGTLRLSVDDYGLLYEVDLADTSVARDVAIHLDRQDIHSSSFAFNVTEEVWRTEKQADGTVLEIREIHDLTLYDVSPCTYAAYTGVTPVGLGGVPATGNPRPFGERSKNTSRGYSNIAARLRELERDAEADRLALANAPTPRPTQRFSKKLADVLARVREVERIEAGGRHDSDSRRRDNKREQDAIREENAKRRRLNGRL